MIVETVEYARYTAFTFADGIVVRVRRNGCRAGNLYDMEQMATQAYMIRAMESSETRELAETISTMSHKVNVLLRFAKLIEVGNGPLAEAVAAHNYASAAHMAKKLKRAAKEIRRALTAVNDGGFLDSVSIFNVANQQPEEEPEVESTKPVNRIKANGKPLLNGVG